MEFASEDQATCGQCLKRLERIKAWKGNLWRYKKHPSPSAEITVRLRNALTRHLEKDDVTEDDIRRLSELDDESLTGIKGFGVKCLKEVRDYFGPLLSEEAP